MDGRRLAGREEDVEAEDAGGDDELEPEREDAHLGVQRGVRTGHHANVGVAEEASPSEGREEGLDVHLDAEHREHEEHEETAKAIGVRRQRRELEWARVQERHRQDKEGDERAVEECNRRHDGEDEEVGALALGVGAAQIVPQHITWVGRRQDVERFAVLEQRALSRRLEHLRLGAAVRQRDEHVVEQLRRRGADRVERRLRRLEPRERLRRPVIGVRASTARLRLGFLEGEGGVVARLEGGLQVEALVRLHRGDGVAACGVADRLEQMRRRWLAGAPAGDDERARLHQVTSVKVLADVLDGRARLDLLLDGA
mmetsp:Transcript_36517/g.90891  ORF Transcript_36517/g.90891 Transcript_36517/m.90891 type:complete len:313 (-) Transcript_36517:546-1484(-)